MLYTKYQYFEGLVTVQGNFLDEVLHRTKEILNHIPKDSNDLVYSGLKTLQQFFSKDDETHILKTSELVSLIDFLRLTDDCCS